jgi:hypothetical protein
MATRSMRVSGGGVVVAGCVDVFVLHCVTSPSRCTDDDDDSSDDDVATTTEAVPMSALARRPLAYRQV